MEPFLRSMTREYRFRFHASVKPGRGPTAATTPARLDGAAAAVDWFPTPWHRRSAYRPRDARQRHDAGTTLARDEPLGKHMKRLTVLVKHACDKRHTALSRYQPQANPETRLMIVRRAAADDLLDFWRQKGLDRLEVFV